jgi:tetratricopeptide (TPR) repeat protein
VLFLITGRDDQVKDFAPGLVLHAYGIRDAIANGFEVYDFLMGNEAYKFSFGAEVNYTKTVVLERPQQPLNLRTIPIAIEVASEYLRNYKFDRAEQSYRQILQLQSEHPKALYGLGAILQRKGDHQGAEKLYRTLLQVDPSCAEAWFSLGNLYQVQEQLAEAEIAYQEALALAPSEILASAIYQNFGYALQQQSRWEDAISYYQKAQILQPDSQEAAVLLANAHYAQGTLPADQQLHYAELNYTLGNRRQESGDLKVALEYYRQSVQLNPEHAEAHYQMGVTMQVLGDLQGAIAAYQTAHNLQPNNLEIDAGLANALYTQDSLAPERQLHYAAINYEFGNHHRQSGDWNRAIAYYQQSLLMNPDQPEAQYYLGVGLHRRGKWDDAIAHYRLAQTLQPDNIKAELGIADILYAQDQLSAEAKAQYAVMHQQMGNMARQAGDFKGAIEHYRQAIKFQPDFAEVREQVRLVFQEQDDVRIKMSCVQR